MADKVITLADIMAAKPTANFARMDATTDEDIARQIAEDSDTAPEFDSLPQSVEVQIVRQKLAMTQSEFASWLHVPVGTIRNWEQKRRSPDPIAQTLLRIIDREPEAVRRALASDA